METFERVIRFLNIFCAAITSGGMVIVTIAVYPAMKQLEPAMGARIHRAIDLRPDAYMRASVVTALVSGVLLLWRGRTPATRAITAAGLLSNVGIMATSKIFCLPINQVVQSWPDDYAAPEYPQLLSRWGTFHLVRTISSVVALIAYLAAWTVTDKRPVLEKTP